MASSGPRIPHVRNGSTSNLTPYDIFYTVVVQAAGISADHPLAGVPSGRGTIIELTAKSHDAALKPEPSGGLTHSQRGELACRMARLNHAGELASHYETMIEADDALIV